MIRLLAILLLLLASPASALTTLDKPGTYESITDSIHVKANDVTIVRSLSIGLQFEQPAQEQVGILVEGHNCTILNAVVRNFGGTGILVKGVRGCRIIAADVSNCNYAGIQLVDASFYEVDGCSVTNVIGTAPNAYGICDSSTGVRTEPCGRIANCYVSDVPHHEGLDTHAGWRLEFANNVVEHCRVGLTVGVNKRDGEILSASREISVTGNRFIYCKTGLLVSGATGKPATGFTADANHFIDCGDSADRYGGAAQFKFTNGAKFSNNAIVRPPLHGLVIYHDNREFAAESNVVSEQGGYGFFVADKTNDGTLRNCRAVFESKAGRVEKRIANGAKF